jgi:hypothetical protein
MEATWANVGDPWAICALPHERGVLAQEARSLRAALAQEARSLRGPVTQPKLLQSLRAVAVLEDTAHPKLGDCRKSWPRVPLKPG